MTFALALKARVPMIGAQTDDLINLPRVLRTLSGRPVEKMTEKALNSKSIYWVDRLDQATPARYEEAAKHETSIVFVNCQPHANVFDTGVIEPPASMVRDLIEEHISAAHVDETLAVMRGLSLRQIELAIGLTSARIGNLTLPELRKTRLMLTNGTVGLTPLDVTLDCYDPAPELDQYLTLNEPYFKNVPFGPLTPRGLLMAGPAGTGKTSAAKYIALRWKVPLYRIDVVSMLNKYIGASETSVSRALDMVDREEPCVVLFDEIEKVITQSDDSGVTKRILALLLWWMQERKSRVLVVMTTNDYSKLPPELYRTGRIDKVMKVEFLYTPAAIVLAHKMLSTVLRKKPTLPQGAKMTAALQASQSATWSHADLHSLVVETVKKEKWL